MNPTVFYLVTEIVSRRMKTHLDRLKISGAVLRELDAKDRRETMVSDAQRLRPYRIDSETHSENFARRLADVTKDKQLELTRLLAKLPNGLDGNAGTVTR
ncbi:hypothetical protein [Gymnodinialimonas hymeniacidonis]|uniref:hypothetical protein n=1 Tax=Gymnodinialimonas hymeniacidonis TaxID=3126508 RepID=UPI0034C662CA